MGRRRTWQAKSEGSHPSLHKIEHLFRGVVGLNRRILAFASARRIAQGDPCAEAATILGRPPGPIHLQSLNRNLLCSRDAACERDERTPRLASLMPSSLYWRALENYE